MSLRDPSITPPQDYELVPEIKTLLEGSDMVGSGRIEEADHIYAHRHPADDKPKIFCVVRLATIIGGELEHITHHARVLVQVEIAARRDVQNPEQLLSQLHADAYAALVGQRPSLTYAGMALGLSRMYRPTPTALDEDTDEFYSTAAYLAVLDPV